MFLLLCGFHHLKNEREVLGGNYTKAKVEVWWLSSIARKAAFEHNNGL
jgi:hypothetical protein